jgi:hypothetical protein
MAAGDWNKTVGKQRVVWPQPGGSVFVENALHAIDVVVIEGGTAVREDFAMGSDDMVPYQVSIPIMIVPADATVVKTVAIAAPASIGWNDDADEAFWAVDQVNVEEDATTRQLSLIAHLTEGGLETWLRRIAYHVTIFIRGEKYIDHPETLRELDIA